MWKCENEFWREIQVKVKSCETDIDLAVQSRWKSIKKNVNLKKVKCDKQRSSSEIFVKVTVKMCKENMCKRE